MKSGIRRLGVFVFLAYSIWPNPARAFSLSDHTLITRIAVQEFNQCVPQGYSPQAYSNDDLNILDHADLWEDLNLMNKWLRYSHYFRPYETLDLFWRTDATGRIAELSSSTLTLEEVGGLLHYLQDAASPPHLIPVSHDLSDRFENYTLGSPELLTASQPAPDCERLLHPALDQDTPSRLLVESGVGTLRLLTEFEIHAKSDADKKVLTASAFWKEAALDSSRGVRPVGEYGDLGNSFGITSVVMDDRSLQIPGSEYDRTKVSFLRHAIEVSKRLLAYGRAMR